MVLSVADIFIFTDHVTKELRMNIVFVCHGNICRSPMAEYIMKKLLDDRGIKGVTVTSRALHTDALGCGIYRPARMVLDAHGVEYGRRAAALLTQAEYDSADMVIVMDEENYRDAVRRFGGKKVSKLLSHAGIDADVADPWYTDDYEKAYSDIELGCLGLVAELCRS